MHRIFSFYVLSSCCLLSVQMCKDFVNVMVIKDVIYKLTRDDV